MNKEITGQHAPATPQTRLESNVLSRCARLGLATALGASLALCRHDAPQARQRQREPEVRVTGIAAGGRTVSITADGSLDRAQTWQDDEGFHVVLVNGQSELAGSARGVKVRRIGNSLELVVPVARGANVTVQPRGNRLDLVVDGGEVGAATPERAARRAPAGSASEAGGEAGGAGGAGAGSQSLERLRAIEARARRAGEVAGGGALPGTAPKRVAAAGELPAAAGVAPATEARAVDGLAEGTTLPLAPEAATQVAAAVKTDLQNAESAVEPEGGASLGSMIFSLPSLIGALLLALCGAAFVFVRRRRGVGDGETISARARESKASGATGGEPEPARPKKGSERDAGADAQSPVTFKQEKGDRRKSNVTVPFERRRVGQGAEDEATRNTKSLPQEGAAVSPSSLPTVVFGAYRIDQEVSRLVQGKSHSVEVIASRASDDRRAVESSLLKALRSQETDADGRMRARTALEDYGFVARSCASLLLGSENFDRASAAAALGEMRSAHALPFLTEALYDPDAVVRAETVKSLGALGLPSAIGALLDTARRHPDLSADILQPALTACSVESMGLSLGQAGDGRWQPDFEQDHEGGACEAQPAAGYEELPEWVEDATLREALEYMTDEDCDVRVHCAQQLARFQVRRAVEALGSLALHDADPAVRAAAVNSLGLVNHESVFASVLVAMADEAREVRAAAARAFSRLSFDRAEAYARVAATSGQEALVAVAGACVASGLAAQALSRLASGDPRQEHEAASLLTLVLRSGDARPVLEAIEGHRDIEVRVAAVRLLGMMNRPELIEELRAQAEGGGLHPRVRLALSELRTAGETAGREQPLAV
ncbi:MAG TPA: HEAT repeat domain-containing protein [Pyrinomonadaceae bacterium]|nr:HEAT repeat domain-containing protein [Pyrinomonadaceae bacterium]